MLFLMYILVCIFNLRSLTQTSNLKPKKYPNRHLLVCMSELNSIHTNSMFAIRVYAHGWTSIPHLKCLPSQSIRCLSMCAAKQPSDEGIDIGSLLCIVRYVHRLKLHHICQPQLIQHHTTRHHTINIAGNVMPDQQSQPSDINNIFCVGNTQEHHFNHNIISNDPVAFALQSAIRHQSKGNISTQLLQSSTHR